MDYQKHFEEYFKFIKSHLKDSTEHTFRTPLENLLNNVKNEGEISIIHESKKQSFGRPDFTVNKITKNDKDGSEDIGKLGHIEVKKLENEIDSKLIKTKQIQDYIDNSSSLLLSNYRDFVLFINGKEVLRKKLFDTHDKKLKSESIEGVHGLIKEFFNSKVDQIKKPSELSLLLSEKTKNFRKSITEYIQSDDESIYKQRLQGLYNLYKETLFHELTLEGFIDSYSQTVTYGLFISRLNSPQKLKLHSSYQFIPKSLGIIRQLFESLDIEGIPEIILWRVENIIDILNNIDLKSLKKSLSFSNTIDEKDIYVYFYEEFLKKYNKEEKTLRGVLLYPDPCC